MFFISEAFRTCPPKRYQCYLIASPSPCSFLHSTIGCVLQFSESPRGRDFPSLTAVSLSFRRCLACSKCLLSIYFRRMIQENEPHRSPKIASCLPLTKETERGKRRESNSRPPVPFPVRTRRVIESFQRRLRKRHADDPLHKPKVSSVPRQLPGIYFGLQASNSNIDSFPAHPDVSQLENQNPERTNPGKEHAESMRTQLSPRPIRWHVNLGYQPIGHYYCLLPPSSPCPITSSVTQF